MWSKQQMYGHYGTWACNSSANIFHYLQESNTKLLLVFYVWFKLKGKSITCNLSFMKYTVFVQAILHVFLTSCIRACIYQCYQWRLAKNPPYKRGIATYGATMAGGASQIAYGCWHKFRHGNYSTTLAYIQFHFLDWFFSLFSINGFLFSSPFLFKIYAVHSVLNKIKCILAEYACQ